MRFHRTGIPGAYIVELEPLKDDRGFFARTWCAREFREKGLNDALAQCNVSFSYRRGTLRGMHYQAAPHEEAKLVRCVRGAIFDVIIDLRPGSHSYMNHVSVDLAAGEPRMIYVPEGCAHGFQTLEDDTEVLYQMSVPYAPGYARGVRWNDPAFGIDWPIKNPVILERDANYPDFVPET